MTIQNFFTSRDNNANSASYVGQTDRLWWDPTTNAIYRSDGNTAGGIPINLGSGLTTSFNVINANTINSNFGNINGELIVAGNISPATVARIGGIKAGPGANVSNDGTLTINTAGLAFSFGDFTANANLLTLVNINQNMVLATKGNAEVQLVGNIGFYRTNGFPPNVANRYFSASDIGQIMIQVTATDGLGAVEIIGSQSGNLIAPGISGAMLHITGQLDTPCRLYYDGNSDYVSMVARRWNGNVDVPTQVLANDDVLRINSTAATDVGMGNVAMAQIRTTALENQTTTAQGSSITFTVTPVGSSAASRVDVANITVANGVTATKFTTAGTITATGNIIAGNVSSGIGVYSGNVTAANFTTAGTITATGNITAGNLIATGGISDSIGSVRSLPQNGKSTNYTLQSTDNGQMINVTSGNITVPANVFVSPFGQIVSIFNNQNAANAIVQGSGVTMRLAGTASTGSRTLARYGVATVICVAANTFVISGAGLT